MVIKYGMSDKLGFLNYEEDSEEIFLGRDLGHSRSFGEKVAGEIDEEVRKIVDSCYRKAEEILHEHMSVLHACAALLLEKERINREEFEALFEQIEK